MIVCICNAVPEYAIRQTTCPLSEIRVGIRCGRCLDLANQIRSEEAHSQARSRELEEEQSEETLCQVTIHGERVGKDTGFNERTGSVLRKERQTK